ncbi:DNA alkylation repair protein [archaeon]|nr:DNA alkylation repair protein [archaeon]
MGVDRLLAKLELMKNDDNIKGMARFGIVYDKAFGISIRKLRKLAKIIGTNHELALELWSTGIREAKLLAVFIDDPAKVTPGQMDDWAEDFESWDDTDQACTSLFDRTPYAWDKIREWAERDGEFVKRGAFSLIAGLAVHDKKAPDKDFQKLFPLIRKHSTDDRHYVKKAVNWALRGIGKRNHALNKKAIRVAEELKNSGDKTARWIGSHALKELTSERVQKRLKK